MKYTAILLAAALALLAGGAAAEDYSVGTLQIGAPWARATPPGADIGAAYMTITNKGTAADRLIGGSATVAGRFELHQMSMEGGVMKMRPVEGGLEIKPGQTIELKPGSLHAMLVGLKEPLRQGQRIKGTLVFQNAGKVDVEFAVGSIGATGGGQRAPAGHSGHGSGLY